MKRIIATLTALAIGFAGLAWAQVPLKPTISPSDLIQVIPNGNPAVGNIYASPQQIAGVPGYAKVVPLTAFALTFANTQTYMLLIPAGTLATGTITTAPNPSDGQRECIRSTQTQTALTFTANTGQTITSPPTALVAGTPVCFTYSLSNATWDQS